MTDLLQQGVGSAWLFIPGAISLGALHGLEPGHSKAVMAAFIVAIRGTVGQAIMLGLAAMVSHTAVVWLLAFLGMRSQWNAESSEPYFQLASGMSIVAIAVWMAWRTWRGSHHHGHAALPEGAASAGQDPHELAHANEIRQRFGDGKASNRQIMLFGITSGLIPCPAAITVLLLCLQLKQVALGATLVLCFSIGLALTMVLSGVVAAISVRHVSRRWSGFGEFARRVPYVSSALIVSLGLYVSYCGWMALSGVA
ncbi:nickel/cobalt efflux protein RcnA [Verminephrobacter eiseniae]|uniref:Nickel/cobalt efflux system n=1 Tax=Verminephrobacter eiseniae (strain EF01-2) TaxID=391735 RepID=A1WLJ1_VEREI|nr:nickel/cobalt efflux protein RcnA [Verminephrobacter eiseniae]ABM58498.1 high-affinity nickel-transporter [Verminephrobacter eiseniae EF01-2]MCW5284074.1 nickel/cobalt efflux protein RcnA [Verminephrobacter eiseniae]MCW5301782.1 nickel/cobalt efflux protein RcnA [Verminephrobacter eiseniae]MCW8180453.1 nickel/cobalt efflux protein RcnA [Verminephrobacter eiseniae]MCW8189516.1 nickel/cobalt efflux protein RcnA [Verminephrobacter eiseniae]